MSYLSIYASTYCRYLHSRDVRALACVDRDMHRAIRALTDATSIHTHTDGALYVDTVIRGMVWSKIDVEFANTASMDFRRCPYPVKCIIAPASREYTGKIIFTMKMNNTHYLYQCMWATDGLIDRSICWFEIGFDNLYVYESKYKLHFTKYIDEIIRDEIMPIVCSLQYDDDRRTHAIAMLHERCAHYKSRDDVLHSAEFAGVLREL